MCKTDRTILAALTLSAAMLAAEGPDDGFVPIFDRTFKDWDGDPVYWRVENRALIGEVRPDTLLKGNNFIIQRGLVGNHLAGRGVLGDDAGAIQGGDDSKLYAKLGYETKSARCRASAIQRASSSV